MQGQENHDRLTLSVRENLDGQQFAESLRSEGGFAAGD